jgi:predicted DNA-binding transcriptional regulator
MAGTNAQLVEQAQKRAAIMGWLVQNPGMHTVADIAEGLGISNGSAGLMLYHMAHDGLVTSGEIEAGKRTYSAGGKPPDEVLQEEPEQVRRRRRKGTREVELVVAGTMIVIGRNPETGRLRISLEDVE